MQLLCIYLVFAMQLWCNYRNFTALSNRSTGCTSFCAISHQQSRAQHDGAKQMFHSAASAREPQVGSEQELRFSEQPRGCPGSQPACCGSRGLDLGLPPSQGCSQLQYADSTAGRQSSGYSTGYSTGFRYSNFPL